MLAYIGSWVWLQGYWGGKMECLSDEVGITLASLFAPATYCFMFISGYYGLKFSVKNVFH